MLGHCADTCSDNGLNFSALLQEPFVEGHLPIYWAILKRPATPVKADHTTPAGVPDAFVLAILDASIPLNSQSVADARLACMTVSDNALFCRLGQRYDAFSPRTGTDRVLLGGTDAVDTVLVAETRSSGGSGAAASAAAFIVRLSVAQFQLRMRVSKMARIEFVARGTLYRPFCCQPLLRFFLRKIVVPCVLCRGRGQYTVWIYRPSWRMACLAWSLRV
jgi:hypothetical protein